MPSGTRPHGHRPRPVLVGHEGGRVRDTAIGAVITGSAGFIGSHLHAALKARKIDVWEVDPAADRGGRSVTDCVGLTAGSMWKTVYHLAAAANVNAPDEAHIEDTLLSTYWALQTWPA